MKHIYYIVDVFTDHIFGGNPLAVFPEAQSISSEIMQKIAREFNFSETTFVCKTDQGLETRIFTPTREIPFAGHPTLGTAFVLSHHFKLNKKTIVLNEQSGPVPVTCGDRYELKVPQSPTYSDPPISLDILASCLGIEVKDIETKAFQPEVVSVGLPFCIVPLKSLKALTHASPDINVIKKYVDKHPILNELYVFASVEEKMTDYRVRMFAPLEGILEDPATGSAAGGFGAYLKKQGSKKHFEITLEQGVEMKRPSTLYVRSDNKGIFVAGKVQMVSQGIFHLNLE